MKLVFYCLVSLALISQVISVVINFNGDSCPQSYPFQCSESNFCAQNLIDCPTNNCLENEFLCEDGTCKSSLIECNCLGVVCPNGKCKTEYKYCEAVAGCPETKPRRCPDGSCQVYTSNCSSNLGPTCLPAATLCIDGVCRIGQTCLEIPFIGCPLLECPNGDCVDDYTHCKICPVNSSIYQCFDNLCTILGVPCNPESPNYLHIYKYARTIDTSSSVLLSFPILTKDLNQIGIATFQSDSLNELTIFPTTDPLNTNTTVPPFRNIVTITETPANIVSKITQKKTLSSSFTFISWTDWI